MAGKQAKKRTKRRPSPTGDNGRDANGRFGPNNTYGQGNPHAQQIQQLRAALLSAISPQDIEAVVKTLVTRALAGDVVAIRELLDRAIGKAQQTIEATIEAEHRLPHDFLSYLDWRREKEAEHE